MQELNIKNKKYYRIYKSLRFARHMFFFMLILTFLVSIVFFRDEITIENVRYLVKYIDVQAPAFANSDKSIEFTTDSTEKNSEYVLLRGNIGVIVGRNFELYDFNGRRLQSAVLPSAKSIVTTGNKYALAYDVDGKEIAIYNSFSNVFSQSYDYSVTGAHILNNGEFAVISSEKNFTSGIIVYNSDFKETFRWMSRDRYINSVFLTSGAKRVVAADTYLKNGVFESEIVCFDTKNGNEIFKTPIPDEIPLKLHCTDRRISLITDKSLKFYNNDGELVKDIEFSSGAVSGFYPYDDCIIISKQTKILGNSSSVEVYNFDGELVYENTYEDDILDISYKNGKLFVLEQGFVSITKDVLKSKSERNVEKLNTDIAFTRVFASDNGEYILVSSSGASKYKV